MNSTVFSRRNLVLVAVVVAIVIAASVFWRMRGGQGSAGDFVEYKMLVDSDMPTTVAVGGDDTVWRTAMLDAVSL